MSRRAAPDRPDPTHPAPAPPPEDRAAAGAVPERPALAPGVELSGELPESGFAQRQWLAQRDGRFVQLTELLYRVAEQADGRRTLGQMAAGVSKATGRRVSAANVRQLLAGKLIPLGLVARADGTVAPPAGGGGARSPLAVNLRLAMVSPRVVDALARACQWLYRPPILLGALLVAAAAQLWLFLVHGLAASVRAALYSPGLLLAVLGLIVVGTAFHEVGHAAALR